MLIRGLIRLFYYAVLAYLAWTVYRLVTGAGRKTARRPGRSPDRLNGSMVKDEVCGLYLPKENALVERIGGRERYFCSKECRAKALASAKPPEAGR